MTSPPTARIDLHPGNPLQRFFGRLCYVAAMRAPGRRLRRVVLVMGLAFVIFLISTARLFVWPPSDAPSHVDAIVALGVILVEIE